METGTKNGTLRAVEEALDQLSWLEAFQQSRLATAEVNAVRHKLAGPFERLERRVDVDKAELIDRLGRLEQRLSSTQAMVRDLAVSIGKLATEVRAPQPLPVSAVSSSTTEQPAAPAHATADWDEKLRRHAHAELVKRGRVIRSEVVRALNEIDESLRDPLLSEQDKRCYRSMRKGISQVLAVVNTEIPSDETEAGA